MTVPNVAKEAMDKLNNFADEIYDKLYALAEKKAAESRSVDGGNLHVTASHADWAISQIKMPD